MSVTPKLTHEVILDGGMFVDPTAGGCVRFFSKSRFKAHSEVIGPLVMPARAMDERFLNLFLYSPILYQASQRAKLDAIDLQERFKTLVTMEDGPDYKELVVQILAQLIALQHAMDVVQEAVREGLDFVKADQFLNSSVEVRSVNNGDV